ncbi:MAG: tetratricopeptide repeat protein [Candidatus Tectomicrobia bacterium]|uniref:Tetratricopeptide repeat protein n=1 Tax=Tectimicrobiota bacterium TaxID=2528274 RepID=A0A932CME0_UNCTE|nr:tetratricopeptide repeat protein [Candidatus Tectomicrobia bacterium]
MVRLVNEHCIPYQAKVPDAKDLIQRYHQIWTPYINFTAADGVNYHAFYGFLPPEEFAPQILLGRAKASLHLGDYGEAGHWYQELVDRYPQSHAAPEALYWRGIVAYRESHNADDLLQIWRELRQRYPDSIWRMKQSFTE